MGSRSTGFQTRFTSLYAAGPERDTAIRRGSRQNLSSAGSREFAASLVWEGGGAGSRVARAVVVFLRLRCYDRKRSWRQVMSW